jgi:hypothetical protein
MKYHIKLDFIIFFIFRFFLFVAIFRLTPNTVDQFNISYNFSQGNSLKLMLYDFDFNPKYYNYYEHPKLFSIVLGGVFLVTRHVFFSLSILVVLLILWEYLLINFITKVLKIPNKNIFLFILLSSIYLGHLDRGTITDYFSMLFAISFILFVFHLHLKSNFKTIDFFLYTVFVILIPMVKYNMLALLFVAPILDLVFEKGIIYKRLSFLAFPIILSLTIFYFGTYQFVHVTKVENGFFLDLNLLRIDYFWFHYGYELDRVFKYISWKSKFLWNLNFWNIAQIMTITFYIGILKLRGLNILDKIKNSVFYKFILIITFVHMLFMVFLSVTNAPESPAFYGIDSKIWVFVEEARYFNFLTFLITLIFFKIIFTYFNRKIHFLILLILLIGYGKTLYAKTDGFSACILFECYTTENRIMKLNSIQAQSEFFNDYFIRGTTESRNSQIKLLGHIFGHNAGHYSAK